MRLTPQQSDRAVGVLLGSAAGDALGVPYENGCRPLIGDPEPLGGGLGGIAPGQWSDDTEMALAIAVVAATGCDLRTEQSQDAIAAQFLRRYDSGTPDIGNQTRAVLSRRPGSAAQMRSVAWALHDHSGPAPPATAPHTHRPVALANLGDVHTIAGAARATRGPYPR